MKIAIITLLLTFGLAFSACAQAPTQTPAQGPGPTATSTSKIPVGAPTPTYFAQPGLQPLAITVTCSQFATNPNVARTVDTLAGAIITVTLCVDPTSGYAWPANAPVSDAAVLVQDGHELNIPTPSPSNPFAVVPAKEVWTFRAAKAGTSVITMVYTRNGQPDADSRSFKLTVTVR